MVSVRGILKAVTPHRPSAKRKITVVTVAAAVAVTMGLTAPALGRILSFPLDDTVNVASQAPNSSAVTLRYHCGFPVIDSQSMVAAVEWNTPPVIQVGRPVPSLALSVQATVAPQVVWGLNLIGVASFDGTADVSSVIHAPQGDIPEKVTLQMPRTAVPSSGEMTVPAPGSTPVVTFGQAGPGKVSAGAVTMHLQGYAANGSRGAPFDVRCTLDAGQSGVVATFDITAAGSPSSASSSSMTQVPTSPGSVPSHPPAPSSAAASGSAAASKGSDATVPTSLANTSSTSSLEAIGSVSTSDTGAAGSAAPTDSTPALAAAAHASTADSSAFASASASVDKGVAVTDWLLVAFALLVVGGAGVFAASRLKKRRGRAAQP